MRRKDRERDADFAREVLRDCEYATLATVNPDGTPYCVPISPVLTGDTLYFHCAPEGQKLQNIAQSPQVCVSGVRHTNLVPEKFTTEYESAVAVGRCETVVADEEKILALRLICEKYAPSNMAAFDDAIARSLGRTGVCKLTIGSITGKAKLYPK